MTATGGLTRGETFSLLRLGGFAPGHRHAFVLRGTNGATLFRPAPVPRESLVAAIGLPGAALHLARQVHGVSLVEMPEMPETPQGGAGVATRGGLAAGSAPSSADAEPPVADALLTRARGHAVGVATADCLPILLARADGACAAVHAGWRGLVAGVLEAALIRLGEGTGIEAAIGPAIGPCCFEVGPEVVARFAERFPDRGGFARAGDAGKSLIDLPSAATEILIAHDVLPSRIHRAALCTRCGPPDLVESYRRDGTGAGRMIAVIGPT